MLSLGAEGAVTEPVGGSAFVERFVEPLVEPAVGGSVIVEPAIGGAVFAGPVSSRVASPGTSAYPFFRFSAISSSCSARAFAAVANVLV